MTDVFKDQVFGSESMTSSLPGGNNVGEHIPVDALGKPRFGRPVGFAIRFPNGNGAWASAPATVVVIPHNLTDDHRRHQREMNGLPISLYGFVIVGIHQLALVAHLRFSNFPSLEGAGNQSAVGLARRNLDRLAGPLASEAHRPFHEKATRNS